MNEFPAQLKIFTHDGLILVVSHRNKDMNHNLRTSFHQSSSTIDPKLLSGRGKPALAMGFGTYGLLKTVPEALSGCQNRF